MLTTKPDLDNVLERYDAWWRGGMLDRPLLTIGVRPAGGGDRTPPRSYSDERSAWMDIEGVLDAFERSLEGRTFFADTVPLYMPNLGPDICATLFGAELGFGPHTSWSTPVVQSCRDILTLRPDFDCEYWTTIRRMTDRSIERSAGRWLTGITDLHTNGDLVAALRSPQELCLDIADDPEGVALAVQHVTDFFPAIFDDLYNRIAAAGLPCGTWAPCLYRGRSYVPSCDFICMISPQTFADAILPSLVREMRYLDRSLFHLDGPGALRHLDALLAQEDLHALQWIWGAGNGPAAKWIDVYRRSQAAGKSLQIVCEDPADAMNVAHGLDSPNGTWFSIQGSYSLEEAQALLDDLCDWSAGR